MTLIISIALILLSFGCQPPQTVTTTNANVNTSSNINTNAAPVNAANTSVAEKPSQARLSVTLPVLDAMFSEEAFAGDLKSDLQLTEDQIAQIKKISHDSVTNLNDSGDTGGSTRAATAQADKQIREILGDDKAGKFAEFVGQRWSGEGDEVKTPTNNSGKSQPNSIPTDTRIVVNAPAYRMDIFQEGKLVKSYKIGIGYPEFPLPSGMRKADTIIFNPTWTPPDEAWVKGKIEPGKKIEAGSKDNPLGPIKIPIGLPSLIHGGKSPARLGGFASHGCVGLTNPQVQDFAVELSKLAGQPISPEDVKKYEQQKTETKNVKLDKTVPVELRYETIVVEDGKLKIYRDVYEKGTNTEENLQKVLQAYGVSLDSLSAPERDKIMAGLQQMAMDATGNAVEPNSNSSSNMTSNSNADKVNADKKSSGNSNSTNSNVTRNIKGKKELSFDIAALKGKGYPAPVGIKQ